MEFEKIKERIILFNEIVDRLQNSSFLKKEIKKKLSYAVKFRYEKEKTNVKTKINGPTDESINAFLLTYRMFIYNKDDVSFSKVDKYAYRCSSLKEKFYERFKIIVKNTNDIFNSPTNVTSDGHKFTVREIHDMFIKGNLAHIQEKNKNRRLYKDYKDNQLIYTIFNYEFVSTLVKIMNEILSIKKLNNEVLEFLSTQDV